MSAPEQAPARESGGVRWLRGDASDRARYTDMHARLRQAHRFSGAVGVVKVVSCWWFGPWLLVPVLVATITMAGGIAAHRRSRVPELVSVVIFAALQVNLALSVLFTGGGTSPLMPLLVVPVVSQAVCFRGPVLLAGAAFSGLMAAPAVLLATALPSPPETPPLLHLLGYLATLTCAAVSGHALGSADRSSRDEAVIDPMTGLFNRLTLAARFAEVQQQARDAAGSVGLVMVDVDHFKQVNDTHGHDRGDRVLREFADRLRGSLRSTDLAYRVGGEEFVVLLPGHDLSAATAVAERIRADVAAAPLASLALTVSAGVASGDGVHGTLADLLGQADAALYAAKNAGRDTVVAAGAADRLPCSPAPRGSASHT